MTWAGLRDKILFFTGLSGMVYEVVFRRPPDMDFIPYFLGMMGLPAFLRNRDTEDRRRNDDDDNDRALESG